jgi:hypothetical protein
MVDSGPTESAPAHTGRKLYLVPMVVTAETGDAPEGYNDKVEAFWREAAEHVRRLEGRFGAVRKIYHESVAAPDADVALKNLQRVNAPAFALIDRKLKLGAQWVSIEDADLLQEVVDWSRCLRIVASPGVVRQVAEFLRDASHRRNSRMAERIDATLDDDQAGLLIIGQDHAVQFPTDVQIFYVSPPSLDEIARLLREASRKEEKSST